MCLHVAVAPSGGESRFCTDLLKKESPVHWTPPCGERSTTRKSSRVSSLVIGVNSLPRSGDTTQVWVPEIHPQAEPKPSASAGGKHLDHPVRQLVNDRSGAGHSIHLKEARAQIYNRRHRIAVIVLILGVITIEGSWTTIISNDDEFKPPPDPAWKRRAAQLYRAAERTRPNSPSEVELKDTCASSPDKRSPS